MQMRKKTMSLGLLVLLVYSVLLPSFRGASALVKCVAASAAEDASNAGPSSDEMSFAVTSDMITYAGDDFCSDWRDENPNYIKLDGTRASLVGSGALIKGREITIVAPGVYVISGKLDDGQIIVEVKGKGVVKLVLNGMEISCHNSAPIYVRKAGKTIISLPEGAQNLVTDGEDYFFSDPESDEPSAAIFSKDDLTINGTGSLTVHANYNDGITCKDILRITGGNINIYASDDGLVGRDMVLVQEGHITIQSGGDGIKSTNDTDTTKGFVAIEGGAFAIEAGADGIQAKTSVLTTGGEFDITCGGGSANAVLKVGDYMNFPMGRQGGATQGTMAHARGVAPWNASPPVAVETESDSAKGIKASSNITIRGGVFNIDSADDAIHSNNSITIAGGVISIASGDDGVHADSSIVIEGGKVYIKKSYEGIESAMIAILGGDTRVVSSDDGINVSGGDDGAYMFGRPEANTFSFTGDQILSIDGGYIFVDALGDGLDVNGSIYMTNGTVIISGPTANNNGALDYYGVFEVSGGLLVAAGSLGMAQAPSNQSSQCSIIMNYSQIQQAGRLVHLEDSQGYTVATFAPIKEYQSVVISSPELRYGESYTLYSGGTSTGSVLDGLYAGGEYMDGTKIVDLTLSSTVTWLSEAGVTTNRGFNPMTRVNPGFWGNQTRPGMMTRP